MSPQIILVRGWLDLYSAGIDQLARELQSAGYTPLVYRDAQSRSLGSAIIDHAKAHADRALILIGFSYGADDVVKIGRRMNDAGLPLALLITIDPVTPGRVSPNVARTYDFYQGNGWLDMFPFFRGIPLESTDGRAPIDNINIHDFPNLHDPSIGHAHIAGYDKVHQQIIRIIQERYPQPSTQP